MMKSRKDKINFLKGIQSGTRSVHELRLTQYIVLIREEGETNAQDKRTGKIWTQADIAEHQRQFPQDRIVTVVLKRG
jgi:hypothetical protein